MRLVSQWQPVIATKVQSGVEWGLRPMFAFYGLVNAIVCAQGEKLKTTFDEVSDLSDGHEAWPRIWDTIRERASVVGYTLSGASLFVKCGTVKQAAKVASRLDGQLICGGCWSVAVTQMNSTDSDVGLPSGFVEPAVRPQQDCRPPGGRTSKGGVRHRRKA